jgi:hypothetical protein
MTIQQQSSFFSTLANLSRKDPKHRLTGTRLLAKHEAQIRKAVALGHTNERIAMALSAMPNSPFKNNNRFTIEFQTRMVYVSQIRSELNMTRNW